MSNHIENLKISNFKCFKELGVSNIGRVNLMGGKNNVGKTAFLDAVDLFVSSNTAYDLFNSVCRILKKRQDLAKSNTFEIDFIYDNGSKTSLSSNKKVCSLEYAIGIADNNLESEIFHKTGEIPTERLILSVNEDKKNLPVDAIYNNPVSTKIFENKTGTTFISPSKTDEQYIALLYGSLIELDKEDFLNQSLTLFDDNLLGLKQIIKEGGIVLKIKLKNKKSLVLLSSLGEGINRYIAILSAIWASKDSVLLIDEIENGIHYTNYKKLWQIIFQASVDANCQIFVTTHSGECIKAFNEVQLDNQYDACNSQYFEFYRNVKTDLIKASAIDKETLQFELSHEGRVRGE